MKRSASEAEFEKSCHSCSLISGVESSDYAVQKRSKNELKYYAYSPIFIFLTKIKSGRFDTYSKILGYRNTKVENFLPIPLDIPTLTEMNRRLRHEKNRGLGHQNVRQKYLPLCNCIIIELLHEKW